jgi:outer membrane protein, heavy metal efflux system
MQWFRVLVPVSVVILCTGCQSYQAKPLVPSEILKEVEASRKLLTADQIDEHVSETGGGEKHHSAQIELSARSGFVQATVWMRQNSPKLKKAMAEYDQARSLADIGTPLPNPAIFLGSLIGANLDTGASHRVQPLVDFGFAIPLSGRLSAQDNVNQALANEALMQLVVTHRREYLELRRLFSDRHLTAKRLAIQEAIRESSLKTMALTERLVEAGAASALDRGLMELESVRLEALLRKTELDHVGIEEALSRLIGISIELISAIDSSVLPEMKGNLRAREDAKSIMVSNNPSLALLRARYEVSERRLQLELKKQYPDLRFGASFEGDPGDTKKIWGLGIGIAIPIFDRNQQGIEVARKDREKVRSAYEATLSESLATLEGLHSRYSIARENHRLLRDVALPRAEANVEVALRSIEAGAIDSLKYLEVVRTMRSLLIEAFEAEREAREVLSELEKIMGVPLALYPAEAADDYPFLPGETGNRGDQDSRNITGFETEN